MNSPGIGGAKSKGTTTDVGDRAACAGGDGGGEIGR